LLLYCEGLGPIVRHQIPKVTYRFGGTGLNEYPCQKSLLLRVSSADGLVIGAVGCLTPAKRETVLQLDWGLSQLSIS